MLNSFIRLFGLTRYCAGAWSWVIATEILLTLILCSQIQMNNFLTELTTTVDIYYSNIDQTVQIWTIQSPQPTPQQDNYMQDFRTEWQRFYY